MFEFLKTRRLKSSDPDDRMKAALDLQALTEPATLQALTALLSDDYERVQWAAAMVLSVRGSDRAIDTLINILKSVCGNHGPEYQMQEAAKERLGLLVSAGTPRALAGLKQLALTKGPGAEEARHILSRHGKWNSDDQLSWALSVGDVGWLLAQGPATLLKCLSILEQESTGVRPLSTDTVRTFLKLLEKQPAGAGNTSYTIPVCHIFDRVLPDLVASNGSDGPESDKWWLCREIIDFLRKSNSLPSARSALLKNFVKNEPPHRKVAVALSEIPCDDTVLAFHQKLSLTTAPIYDMYQNVVRKSIAQLNCATLRTIVEIPSVSQESCWDDEKGPDFGWPEVKDVDTTGLRTLIQSEIQRRCCK